MAFVHHHSPSSFFPVVTVINHKMTYIVSWHYLISNLNESSVVKNILIMVMQVYALKNF